LPLPNPSQLEDSLRSALAGRRVAVLAVGNPLRADDGFGPAAAARLAGLPLPPAATVIDAGGAPENFTGLVRRHRPEVVLVLDAADFGGRPGELRTLDPGELSGGSPSTHAAGLGLLFEYLRGECGAEGLVLAVQAGSAEFGRPMSPEVAEAVERAALLLAAVLGAGAGTGAGGRA